MAASRKIIVEGSQLDADKLLLRSGTIIDRLSQPFEINLELLSPDESLDFDKLLGHPLLLSVGLDSGESRYFHGYVTRFAQSGRLGRYATYQARVVPWLWFLTRTADCRIFQNQTAPDIVKQVFKDLGFTDIKDSLTKSYRTREYCVQYRETDFNFVQRLMEEEGIYYFFKHTQSTHTLVMADSYGGHEAFPDYETIDYFPPSENEAREKDHIYDWHLSREVQSGKYVLTDYDFTKPRAPLKTQYVQKHEIPKSDFELFDYPGGYAITSDGDHYVRTRLEALQAQYERADGEGNARGLAVGSLFKLAGFPRKDQNKEYLLTSATYRLHGGDFESGTAGEQEDFTCKFAAMSSKTPFRAPITTRKPAVAGPQTATVVGPGGEEIFTDKYGRVKVKFHWDRSDEKNDKSSCWIRVSQIWAGKQWGWMSIPRIGQEVVVDFLEGDPDQPLITGRVYNQDNMPPYELPGNKTQSGIKTRSSMDGSPDNFNEIRFEDKKGSEQLFIHAEKNQDIEVENDETQWVGHDRTRTVDNDENVTVKRDRSMTIERDKKEHVLRDKTIEVGRSHNEVIQQNMSVDVGSNLSESVGLNYSESVGAAMELSIGAFFNLSVGGASTESVGGAKGEAVGGNKTENIGVNKSVDVGKNLSETIGENQTVEVGKDLTETIQGQHQETVTKSYMLKAKKIQLVADDEISIKTGSAEIVMKKNGDITLKGAKINVKGSGDVVIKGSQIKQN